MTTRPPRRIVMLGTSFETHGGIASVVNAYRAAGLFARWPIEYVQTHCDGSRFAKWSCAIGAFFSMLFLICRHPRAVLHVHAASRASFWRKAVLMSVARMAGWPVIFHLHGGGFATFYRGCSPWQRGIVRYFLDRNPAVLKDDQLRRDLCASVQAAIVDVLAAKTIRAAKHVGVRCVTASGGVTCNSRLRAELQGGCDRERLTLRLAERSLCTDNAAMIGILAERKLLRRADTTAVNDLDDEVIPTWTL